MTNVTPIRQPQDPDEVFGDELECSVDDLEQRAQERLRVLGRRWRATKEADVELVGILADTIRLARQFRRDASE